ncbi:hypothetical protein [Gaoshiqia sediminis]|uniref:Uncharacterized protein n=1 Tax=Gaoshiqia sediminis TaxID=2986998 RepID=A0AA41YAJ4_9BACT|nr:hypothetical protein [Gaoshiqia sediminis]MCW0484033.1 hypothetical protein [Gaoshiqia sediminis]
MDIGKRLHDEAAFFVLPIGQFPGVVIKLPLRIVYILNGIADFGEPARTGWALREKTLVL